MSSCLSSIKAHAQLAVATQGLHLLSLAWHVYSPNVQKQTEWLYLWPREQALEFERLFFHTKLNNM